MKRLPPEPPEHGATPSLLASALATVAPHAEHLPLWLSTFAATALTVRSVIWKARAGMPSRWLAALVAVAAATGIYLQYRTLFGRDAGVAFLVLLMAVKPLEMKAQRDAIVVLMVGYFLLLTHYFYSQSIPTGLWLLAAATLQTATLIRLFGGPQPTLQVVRHAGILLAQAVPFMLVLFLLFPRINGPLWGMPQDAYKAGSGLPETISPGSISSLVLNGAVAFRVRFEGAPPRNSELYWRGPVMDEFDGTTWRAAYLDRRTPPKIETRGAAHRYETTLEAHNQRWLLALDMPTTLPPNAWVGTRLEAISSEPVRQRTRFTFTSHLDYTVNVEETDAMRDRALQLPKRGNPKSRALADTWRAKHADPQRIVDEALLHFAREGFRYTLEPPLLSGDVIDEFLFRTHEGFCEHYASAFVFLMRAAGVPARVVAGYQGGELNPVDGYLVIRQSDAHAWAEIWIAGRGWVRVDPTAASVPSRIEQGIAAALPESQSLPYLARIDIDWLRQLRYRFDAVNNAWNQWVLGYNPERQREVLSRLGFGEFDWHGMAAGLAVFGGLSLLAIMAWALWQRPPLDPAQRAWLRLCRRLDAQGVSRAAWEGPLDFAQRVARERPEFSPLVRDAAEAYCAARYARSADREDRANHLTRLRQATRRLPFAWRIR